VVNAYWSYVVDQDLRRHRDIDPRPGWSYGSPGLVFIGRFELLVKPLSQTCSTVIDVQCAE